MALVPCAQCRQPFYASCHDASCSGAVCPYCEYAEILPTRSTETRHRRPVISWMGSPRRARRLTIGHIARRCTPLTRLDTRGAALL